MSGGDERGRDRGDLVIPVPPEYSEAEADAYKAGFLVCADLFANAAATYREALSEVSDGDLDDDEPAVCPECGSELLSSMGADETATPAGSVCPDCEL